MILIDSRPTDNDLPFKRGINIYTGAINLYNQDDV